MDTQENARSLKAVTSRIVEDLGLTPETAVVVLKKAKDKVEGKDLDFIDSQKYSQPIRTQESNS